jgi:hypothetical protein
LLLVALSSPPSLFLGSDFRIRFALGFSGVGIRFALGFSGVRGGLGFSFSLGFRGSFLLLLRDAFLSRRCAVSNLASSENCAVCRAVEMTAFFSALLAREFSVSFRLPSALEKISGAYLSAPRDFAISTALRASYTSKGTLGSRVSAKG